LSAPTYSDGFEVARDNGEEVRVAFCSRLL
jgi:hypothetical protein